MTETPLTLTSAATALREGKITSVELTRVALDLADRFDDAVGVYVSRFDEQALESAARADAELGAGQDRGPLHGIPFGVKDVIACAEGETTAQSLILDREWGRGKDAPAVSRARKAGAVITGKTTTMEFATGMPDPETGFPIPRNPWDLATWPGGSSSGAGSGVATGMFLAGFGTDTAGSIRVPAAYCGVTGLVPTYGRVPKSGVVPFGYSLDRVGPLARSAEDCAAVLQAIAGPHPSDPTSVDRPGPHFVAELADDLSGMRIGVVREHHFPDDADRALAPAYEATVATLCDVGAAVVEVALPYWSEMITADMVTTVSEALAYHRVDAHRWQAYGATTRQTLARGASVSGADYVQAQRVRRVAQLALADLFTGLDAVICPTIATGAPRAADLETRSDVIDRLLEHTFTPYWNSVGNPVMAVPMGFTAAGLPLSFQVAGRPFDEATVLHVGAAFQTVTDHHLHVPGLVTRGAAA